MAELHTATFCDGYSIRFICSVTCFFFFVQCTDALLQSSPALKESDPLITMKDHCPLFKKCDADGTYNETIVMANTMFDGCCLHCDCSDACFLKGNCCPGKKRQNLTTSKKCVQTFVDYKRGDHLPALAFQNSSFILQTSNLLNCDKEILAKCITPNTSLLIEVTPVTSNLTNYRNVFCAKCDGHQHAEIKSWPAKISCENTVGSQYMLKRNGESDFQMLERLSHAHCQIFWNPLYPAETEPCIHSNDIVSTCNTHSIFGEMEFAIEICQSLSLNESLTVPIFQGGSIYKNVFCAYCNYALLSQAENVAGNCTLSDLAPIHAMAFNIFIDMTTYNMLESPANCLNYKTKACITLACKLSEKRVEGQCRPVVTWHSGFCFDFRLTATFNTHEVAFKPNALLAYDILVHVNLFQTINELIPNIVNEQVKQQTVNENGALEVHMSAVVMVVDLVTMDEANSGTVKGLREYNAYAKWVNESYTVKLTSTPFKPIPSDVNDFVQFYDTEEYEKCNIVYAMSEIQSCEGVETRDFSKLAFNRVQVDHLMFLPHEYLMLEDQTGSGDTVFICRHTFEERLGNVSASGYRNAIQFVVFIVAIGAIYI